MSIARHHAEWLSLLDISGPFLSMPVLLRAFPHGLNEPDPALRQLLRATYAEWHADPALHHVWVRWVLEDVLKFPAACIQADSPLALPIPEYGETLRPTFAIVEPDAPHRPRLLVQVVPPTQDLEQPLKGARWKTAPASRMMLLLHASGVRLGLLTNGEQWMLVDAPKGETTGFISWYAQLWLDEPLTLRSFCTLLEARRFFGMADPLTLEALLAESVNDQQEVTDQLGLQVRRAVEVLLQACDRADEDAQRTLLHAVPATSLYEAALTVMMRLVVLLCAEERDLLLLGDAIYDANYAVSTLGAQLREVAEGHSEELLERRYDAWSRLLATFRAIHGGIAHDRLTLPAYGGSLFDPARFPFLEQIHVDNRTVLHLLDALQWLRVKVPGGGPAEARRLSFRSLDIEQIGHVYEGLLDHTARRADAVLLGVQGSHDPLVPLAALVAADQQGQAALLALLLEQTGRTSKALERALTTPLERFRVQQVRTACANDETLFRAVLPFAGLLRDDDYERPLVILPGSIYVAAGSERRATGTHYTPRSLTEPVVQYALEPLVYHGPAEGLPREQWRLRSARELLALRVCDMAMGSGAFLVQACRYLAERLLEAEEQERGAAPAPAPAPANPAAPAAADPDEDALVQARRRIVDRCIYGVDKNPLAVEMAKLSLWLVTLQKGRPFSFLDHALKAGDSLLGVRREQLDDWSLTPRRAGVRAHTFLTYPIQRALSQALILRREIQALPVNTVRDAAMKADKLRVVTERMELIRLAADALLAAELEPDKKQREQLRGSLQHRLMLLAETFTEIHAGRFTAQGEQPGRAAFAALRADVDARLGGHRPFHWEFEFPEVFMEDALAPAPLASGQIEMPGMGIEAMPLFAAAAPFAPGFMAIIGNPPFQGGQRITGALGTAYRDYLIAHLAHSTKGNADLCAYFFLRAGSLLHQPGSIALIATNTIAQGDTREVGLDQLTARGFTITRAVPSRPWPGTAAVEVAQVWLWRGQWQAPAVLNDATVPAITPYLSVPGKVAGQPHRLAANAGKSFQGSIVLGMGFVLEPEEAQALIAKDPRNAEVLFPYLNGEDLNSSPDQSPSRWVINFFDWSEEKAAAYPDCWQIIQEKVRPERQRKKPDGSYALRKPLPQRYWHYADKRPALYATIAGLERVLVLAQTSKTVGFVFVPAEWIYAHKVVVFNFSNAAAFATLQSAFQVEWAWQNSSTMKTDLSYTPTDSFETFPFPADTSSLAAIGEQYHEHRRQVMLARQEGLTKTYNRFHDATETAADISELRRLHVAMDAAVAAAYGWAELELGHGFHPTKQGVRYTISEAARREVLDRLLALNHERHAAEVAAGGKRGKGKRKG